MRHSSLLKVYREKPVRDNLALTSQVTFCGLPLRLDSYVGCAFDCGYCFARRRGGGVDTRKIRLADPGYLRRMLERAFGERGSGVLAQFLRRRTPIHFGGMSDPFQPAERTTGISLEYLRALSDFAYPVVISTRSPLIANSIYLDAIRNLPHVVVQFSFSTIDDKLSSLVEPHAPTPASLLATMELLAQHGVKVTCRWQPLIPGFSDDPKTFVRTMAAAGALHVAVEHLKVPLERDRRWTAMEAVLGRALRREYIESSARRDGREYVLPSSKKLGTLLEIRSEVHQAMMTFGAADNEYQYMSDTESCCSGIDQFVGFENWYAYQLGAAVRRSGGGMITYNSIKTEWRPRGSIDRFLNSRTRLGYRGEGATATDHIRHRFNTGLVVGGLRDYAGVVPTALRVSGLPAYGWDEKHTQLWSSLLAQQPRPSIRKRNI
jgi:DNA repair photolyase